MRFPFPRGIPGLPRLSGLPGLSMRLCLPPRFFLPRLGFLLKNMVPGDPARLFHGDPLLRRLARRVNPDHAAGDPTPPAEPLAKRRIPVRFPAPYTVVHMDRPQADSQRFLQTVQQNQQAYGIRPA